MQSWAFEGLEPCDGKLSRTDLRGKGGRKAPARPGQYGYRDLPQPVLSIKDIIFDTQE